MTSITKLLKTPLSRICLVSLFFINPAAAQVANYADPGMGTGQHKEEIVWLTWDHVFTQGNFAASGLQNGTNTGAIQNGVPYNFTLPSNADFPGAATLTATFNNISYNPTQGPLNNPLCSDLTRKNCGYQPGNMQPDPPLNQPGLNFNNNAGSNGIDNSWQGSALQYGYNVPGRETLFSNIGTGPLNEPGQDGQRIDFDVTLSITVGGITIPVDFVFSDAETTNGSQSGGYDESIRATTQAGADPWQLIEVVGSRYNGTAAGGTTQGSNYQLSGLGTNAVTIEDTEQGWGSGSNAVPVLLANNTTNVAYSFRFDNQTNGHQGIMVGLLFPKDHGDAPESYGHVAHYQDMNANPQPALVNDSDLSLGALNSADNEQVSQFSANADGDDNDADGDDEDAFSTFPIYDNSGTYTLTVPYGNQTNATATICGWIDFDLSGAFGDSANERVCAPAPNGGSSATLQFTGLPEFLDGTARFFSRFRICSIASQCNVPTGLAADGEVEDYLLVADTLPVTLASASTERTGEKVKFDWSTSSELFNVGFQLWGLDAADSKWEKLHGWLVRSGSGNAVEPQSYTKTVRVPKTIKELTAVGISSVDNDGTEHYYGPFNVGQSYGNLNSLKPIAWNHIRAQTDAQMLARGYIKDRVHGYRKISTLSGSAASSAAGSQPFIEFKIQASGLYSITAQQLLTAGANWQDIATRDIALTDHQGKAVVRHVSAKGTGTGQARTLGAQGEIYFYAKGVNNKTGVYTDSSVYRLVIDRYKSLNPQYQGKRGISDNYSAYYREQIVLENDNQYNLASAGDDPWLDTSVLSYADQSGSYAAALAVEADAMWDQDSIVTLGLGRGSQLTPVDNDGDGIQDAEHTLEGVVLSSNGDGGLLSLGTQQATGRGEWTVDFTIPAETPVTLFDGKAVVGGVFKPGPGYAFSEVQVDSIELSYARPYVARAGDDYLAFEAPFDNASGYEVTVPNTGWPLVFAYSNGNLVRIALESQQAQTAVDGTRQRQVRFAALAGANIANAPVAYWVSGKNGLMRVNELSVKTITSKSSLLTQANHAELLVVAHPAFMTPALSNYAEFKRAQGMSVAIINYLEIVDAFGGGQPGPWALTKYLNAVHAQSSEFAHVLLVGGSSYDHTDKLGTGAMTFIPGHYAESAYSNHTVTDTPYVTAADMSLFATIGRWPVRSDADLDSIIASSMAWSAKDHAQGSALVIAEHTVAGEGIDFAAALDGVAAQLPGSWTTDSVSVDAIRTKEPTLSLSQALSKAKGQIISGLEAGPDIVMYNGHGTTSQLSNKGLFKAGDVAGIDSNGAQLWVPMSCYMTYFESTHVNTLAHQLLFSGKAVGISGAMLLSNQSENIATGKALLDSTVNQGLSIGDAVKAHKTAQSTTQLNTNLSHLGDPTLRM